MRLNRANIMILVIFIAFLFVFATSSACFSADSYNWKMTTFFPSGHPQNELLKTFIKMANERTHGAVKITLFEGTLGHPRDHWDMLENGVVNIAFLGDGYTLGRMPIGCLFNLPFELSDLPLLYDTYGEWLKNGYLKEITDYFKILLYRPSPPMYLFLKGKKVTTLEDFKGLKIRALQGMMGKTVSALGATPVSMPGGEIYMGLSTGIIDGVITGGDNVLSRKLYEVSDYGLKLPVYVGIWILSINKDSWNKLPTDLQKQIDAISQELLKSDRAKAEAEETAVWQDIRDKTKLEIYSISSDERVRWKNAIANIADEYINEYSAKGYPVKEAYQIMQEKEQLQK